ncbi:hypothetical protein TIA1EST31_06659 [Cutibacterium acnes FZ1/2/0]|nr:hypothetical protein HMPREF0675_4352 [Cutibacterium acnes SK137]EGL39570.1 hypothetical protein HMPREF9947_0608 [Propionibacterium sp. 409-HC1]EGR89663.1 conserved domain protein [Propionibacterium sp. CC003-HC2]EGR96362.1 conserved domain protein [Cutibacterium acnes SK182]EMF62999.1 hypothetical protein TIA1EST31_06659 [Cutibacterium acnes FZ1/2/0]
MQGKAHRDGPGVLCICIVPSQLRWRPDDVLSQRHEMLSGWFKLLPIFLMVLPVSSPGLT